MSNSITLRSGLETACVLHQAGLLEEVLQFTYPLCSPETREESMSGLSFFRRVVADSARIAPHLGWAIPGSRRLLIIDPFFVNTLGHNFNFNRGLGHFLRAQGWSVKIIGNRHADRYALRRVRAHGLIRSPCFGNYPQTLASFLERNEDMRSDLRLLDFIAHRPDNVVLIHTLTVFELGGIARWYSELPATTRPHLILYLQFPPPPGRSDAGGEDDLIRYATTYFIDSLTAMNRVVVCAGSAQIAASFAHRRLVPKVVPMPIAWPAAVPVRPHGGRLVFGYLGGARRSKGMHLLADAIAQVLARTHDLDFLIQCPSNRDMEPDLRRLRDMHPRVQIRDKPDLSTDEYYATFAGIDALLTPYDPAFYGHHTSMTALEAMGVGKGIIATRGTWHESLLHDVDGAGVVMDDFSAPALARAIMTYAEQRDRWPGKLAAAQRQVRRSHNVAGFMNAVTPHLFDKASVEDQDTSGA